MLAGDVDVVRQLLRDLIKYEHVITSAMHIHIACQSYGIPSALVTFKGAEDLVHGTGIKYRDYAQGVGLPVVEPLAIPVNLDGHSLQAAVTDDRVPEAVMDDIESSLKEGVRRTRDRQTVAGSTGQYNST